MTPARRAELTGDVHLKALLERIRELEEAIAKALKGLDTSKKWHDEVDIDGAWDALKAVLEKKP